MNMRQSDANACRSRAPARGSALALAGHERGFVLVAVLVALVVITLLASAVAVVSERAVAEAQADADAFNGEVAETGTRDTLLYLLSTQRQTFGGLTIDTQVVLSAGQATAAQSTDEFGAPLSRLPIGNEIRLDDTPYLGLGDTRFALQDDAGLYSPNWTFPLYRTGFFTLLKVPPEQWDALDAKRLDYQDPDSLYRLGGAEAGQYRDSHLPPPTNRTLATPLQLRRVLGWGKALEGRDDAGVMALVTASRSVMINVNTAPAQVLQTLPGVDASAAARIVALRQKTPYMLTWQFLHDFNLPMDELQPIGLSAVGYGTLALWHNAGGPLRLVHWTLTPIDEGGRPWRLDYEITLPRDEVTDTSLARTTQTPFLAQPAAAGR
jgi:type II secretory pathway pseudopilin PulG